MPRTVSLRTAILAPLVVAATVAVATGGAVGPGAPFAQAGGQNRAVVVVDTGSSVRAACVLFSEDSISGSEALQRAGMAPVFQGYSGLGSGVCSLNGVGCPSDGSCLTCQAPSYWQYWRSSGGGGYSYSQGGASGARVTDGSVEGWSWGSSQDPPPFRTVDDVCGAEEPPPTTPPATQPPSSGGGAGGAGGGGTAPAGGGAPAGAEPAGEQPAGATTTSTAPGETTTTTAAGDAVDGASTSEGGAGAGEPDEDGQQATSLINDVDDDGSPAGSIALSTAVLGGIGFLVWRARRRGHALAGAGEADELDLLTPDQEDPPEPGGA